MELQKLNELKEKLPGRFAKIISDKLGDNEITPAIVSNVFANNITNPDVVEKVVNAAIELLQKQQQLNDKIENILK